MAFALMVVIDGVTLPEDFHFRNIYRCNVFAKAIEHQRTGPRDRRNQGQLNITAYCKPKMVPEDTVFWD